jgi:hypothetical protein
MFAATPSRYTPKLLPSEAELPKLGGSTCKESECRRQRVLLCCARFGNSRPTQRSYLRAYIIFAATPSCLPNCLGLPKFGGRTAEAGSLHLQSKCSSALARSAALAHPSQDYPIKCGITLPSFGSTRNLCGRPRAHRYRVPPRPPRYQCVRAPLALSAPPLVFGASASHSRSCGSSSGAHAPPSVIGAHAPQSHQVRCSCAASLRLSQ